MDDHAENSIVVASGCQHVVEQQDVDKMLEEMCEEISSDAIGNSASNSGSMLLKGFRERSEGGTEPALPSLPKNCSGICTWSLEPHRGGDAYGHKIANDADVEKVAEEICAMGVKNVIITLGSKGCLIREEGVSYRIDVSKWSLLTLQLPEIRLMGLCA